MKTLKIDLTGSNDFTAAWIADAVCNSAHKGEASNQAKVDELMAEAKTIFEGNDPNGEINQTKLNRLASRIEMHEAQGAFFLKTVNEVSKIWCTLTGKTVWAPYSGGTATPKDATATNAFFADRIAK